MANIMPKSFKARLRPQDSTEMRFLRARDSQPPHDEDDSSTSSAIPQEWTNASPSLRNAVSDDSLIDEAGSYAFTSKQPGLLRERPVIDFSETIRIEQPVKHSTVVHRVGRVTSSALIASLVATAASLALLFYLAYGQSNNGSVWQIIMVRQWATRVITISALVLRTAIDLQAGVAAAMCAAVTLESGSALLKDAALISTARAWTPAPRLIALPILSGARRSLYPVKSGLRAASLILLCITTIVLQFASTILLTDLRLGQLPDVPRTIPTRYDFIYTPPQNRTPYILPSGWEYWPIDGTGTYDVTYPAQGGKPTWQRSPSGYPTFAEYAEPPVQRDGVDDTGTLLRAFLPFSDATSRESIRNYSGHALVLDARVSCQRPRFTNLDIRFSEAIPSVLVGSLTGAYAPSVPDAERLWVPNRPVPFNCSLFTSVSGSTANLPPSVCQLQDPGPPEWYGADGTDNMVWGNSGGGLFSAFANMTDLSTLRSQNTNRTRFFLWGTPMLVFQPTSLATPKLNTFRSGVILSEQPLNYRMSNDTSLRLVDNGTWLDVLTQQGIANYSVSLCYTAWDSARLNVSMHSATNRSEPVAHWQEDVGFFTKPDVLSQLGGRGSADESMAERRILALERRESWVPAAEDAVSFTVAPYLQTCANLNGRSGSIAGNYTGLLHFGTKLMDDFTYALAHTWLGLPIVAVDDTIATLFHNITMASGSVARALSSTITMLSSKAYYDQMPRFQRSTNATQTFFRTVLYPQSSQGLWIVTTLVVVHLALVCISVVDFALRSEASLLGNHWQSVAQLRGDATEDVMQQAGAARDSDIAVRLQAENKRYARFEIDHCD